jgi:hypothetical protein
MEYTRRTPKQKKNRKQMKKPEKTQKTKATPNPTTKTQSPQRTWVTLHNSKGPLATNPTRTNTPSKWSNINHPYTLSGLKRRLPRLDNRKSRDCLFRNCVKSMDLF